MKVPNFPVMFRPQLERDDFLLRPRKKDWACLNRVKNCPKSANVCAKRSLRSWTLRPADKV